MAVWRADGESFGYDLVQNGFVAMFHSREILDETIAGFRHDGYRIVLLDSATWEHGSELHAAFASALGFPDHYGRNLDALYDCLRDVAERDVGWSGDETGLVIVIDHFDRFNDAASSTARAVLEAVADAARLGALHGNRMLCLIRADDPFMELGRIGGTEPQWNPREWVIADRTGA